MSPSYIYLKQSTCYTTTRGGTNELCNIIGYKIALNKCRCGWYCNTTGSDVASSVHFDNKFGTICGVADLIYNISGHNVANMVYFQK